MTNIQTFRLLMKNNIWELIQNQYMRNAIKIPQLFKKYLKIIAYSSDSGANSAWKYKNKLTSVPGLPSHGNTDPRAQIPTRAGPQTKNQQRSSTGPKQNNTLLAWNKN